jgi:hypothetical protein
MLVSVAHVTSRTRGRGMLPLISSEAPDGRTPDLASKRPCGAPDKSYHSQHELLTQYVSLQCVPAYSHALNSASSAPMNAVRGGARTPHRRLAAASTPWQSPARIGCRGSPHQTSREGRPRTRLEMHANVPCDYRAQQLPLSISRAPGRDAWTLGEHRVSPLQRGRPVGPFFRGALRFRRRAAQRSWVGIHHLHPD